MDRRTFLSLSASTALINWTWSESRAQNTPQHPITKADSPVLGMDCHSYPGDRAVDPLRKKRGYRVTCLYLTHAPGVVDQSWLRKRRICNSPAVAIDCRLKATSHARPVRHRSIFRFNQVRPIPRNLARDDSPHRGDATDISVVFDEVLVGERLGFIARRAFAGWRRFVF
jgi:hypothetical protein